MNISEIGWAIRDGIARAWLIARRRPFLRCPFCKGRGGSVDGYYDPEWTECRTCYPHYDDLEDQGLNWFVGRLPLLVWIRARVSIWFGLWYAADLLDVARCWLGLHDWREAGNLDRGLSLCRVCYESKVELRPDWDAVDDRKEAERD